MDKKKTWIIAIAAILIVAACIAAIFARAGKTDPASGSGQPTITETPSVTEKPAETDAAADPESDGEVVVIPDEMEIGGEELD